MHTFVYSYLSTQVGGKTVLLNLSLNDVRFCFTTAYVIKQWYELIAHGSIPNSNVDLMSDRITIKGKSRNQVHLTRLHARKTSESNLIHTVI
jgi:hypothetical protein